VDINFEPLNGSHFHLLLKWLEMPHVKKWWDQKIHWTPELIQEKYGSYVKGYKWEQGRKKPFQAYIITANNNPIGYIQSYNAYDFPREDSILLQGLPKSLAALDFFIGEDEYLGKGLGSESLRQFLKEYIDPIYQACFVDPDIMNIHAIRSYDKAGFRAIRAFSKEQVIWMLKKIGTSAGEFTSIFNQLVIREPIFHHPDQFGRTQQDILDMTCEGFWEVGASGNVYSREDVIDVLLKRYNDPHYQDIWETKDFDLIEIAPNNYLITYVLIQGERITRRSTIWRKIQDKWKILYHQGTVIKEGSS
jgi:aminoglycoside 6'-N-acetyltransferase